MNIYIYTQYTTYIHMEYIYIYTYIYIYIYIYRERDIIGYTLGVFWAFMQSEAVNIMSPTLQVRRTGPYLLQNVLKYGPLFWKWPIYHGAIMGLKGVQVGGP